MTRQQDLFAQEKPATTSAEQPWSLYREPKLLAPALPPPDASERERSLHVALAVAKKQLHELRARLVRVDCIAATWVDVPHPEPRGSIRVEHGALIRRVLCADSDTSLRVAREAWQRDRA